MKIEVGDISSKRVLSPEDVKNSFLELANAQFIRRCTTVVPSEVDGELLPHFEEPKNLFLLPDSYELCPSECTIKLFISYWFHHQFFRRRYSGTTKEKISEKWHR